MYCYMNSCLIGGGTYQYTVEPCLTDTPQQWTPTLQRTVLKVPTVLPFTSIFKQPLNSGHPATPYNEQFSWSHATVRKHYSMTPI